MTNTLANLFEQAEIDPPAELAHRTLAHVERYARRSIRRERRFWASFSLLSLGACALTGWHALSTLASSNFGSYTSLAFSAGSDALPLWKEIGMSLLESLPVIALGIFLACILALLFTTRKTFARSATNPLSPLAA